MANHPGCQIDAVGVSAMLGYVLLDRQLQPLGPAILYADNRAAQHVQDILAIVSQDEIHRITGRRATPELLAPKLLWIGANEPARSRQIRHVIGLKDEIVRRLTGELSTDMAHASYSMLFDVEKGAFDIALIEAIGLDARHLLPDPVDYDTVVGRVNKQAAADMGIKAGTPLVAGGSDGTTAMYGGGILQSNQAVLVSGTTDVLMMGADFYPQDDGLSLTINAGAEPGTYLVGGATGLSGGALQKFEVLFNCSLKSLVPDVTRVPPGADGMLVYPGLAGERAPYWCESSTGMITGLGLRHRTAHVFKALLEGITFRIKHLLDRLATSGLIPEAVYIAGGMSRIELLNQLRADVTGIPVVRLTQAETTCLGTASFCQSALMGGGKIKAVTDSWITAGETFMPDPDLRETYQAIAKEFEKQLQKTS
jgi:xylulokinase